jgi:hypothetical protein
VVSFEIAVFILALRCILGVLECSEMLCAEQNALWQEHRAAVKNYVAAIRELVELVDHSGENPDFNRAHLRIKSARGLCDVAQAALTLHEVEHGCQTSN